MNDFEKMIRDMVANGAKMEDIAQATGDTLNKIQKEQSDWKNQRKKRYEELENKFHQCYADGQMKPEDVGILAALVISPSYPDWKAKDIDEFAEAVVEMIRMRAEMVGKSPMEGIFKVLDMAAEWSKERVDAMEQKVAGKESKTASSNPACSCGSDRTCSHKAIKTDAQRIDEFLRDLGVRR